MKYIPMMLAYLLFMLGTFVKDANIILVGIGFAIIYVGHEIEDAIKRN